VDRKYSTDKDNLSENEMKFYAVNYFRGKVPRSSLNGYLEEVSFEEVSEAINGLAVMGLSEASKKLKETILLFLQSPDIPQSSGLLIDRYANFDDKEYEKFEEKIFKKLSEYEDYFMELDDEVFDALCLFADKNGMVVT